MRERNGESVCRFVCVVWALRFVLSAHAVHTCKQQKHQRGYGAQAKACSKRRRGVVREAYRDEEWVE